MPIETELVRLIKSRYWGDDEWTKHKALFWEEVDRAAEKGDEAAIGLKKKEELYNRIINNVIIEKPLVADATAIALDFEVFRLDKFNHFHGNYVEDNKVDYEKLAEDIAFHLCVVTYKGVIYVYDRSGKFVEGELRVKKLINQILKEHATIHRTKEILERLKVKTAVEEYPFNNHKNLIPVKNGVYDIETGELYPHSPLYGFTYILPITFNPEADCPKIDAFFRQVVREEDVPLLYEIFGYCLYLGYPIHKAFMFVGEGRNGKSTTLRLLERFLGKENVSNVPLQALDSDKFAAAQLTGKLANICADLPPHPMRHTGIFKMLTGEDSIHAQRKFKEPFSFQNHAKLIFSANKTPEVNDNTLAFWERWIILEFPNTFKDNPNINILDEIATDGELSGLFNRAVEALKRLLERGKFTVSRTAEVMKEEWLKRSNSIYAFVTDMLEQDANSYEIKEAVYKAYVEYCEEKNLRAVARPVFGRELPRYIPVRTERKKIAGERFMVWVGIRLKQNEKDDEGDDNFEFQEYDLSVFT